MLPLLRNRSVILFGLSGLLISPIWLALNWLPYGLITLDKVDPDTVAVVSPAITLIPVAYGFFNGPVMVRWFGGRPRRLVASGFLSAASPSCWLP
jgi:hypothetical protein